jgi:1-acyl-sn-glycerol-3-phosphate acyltransferase
MSTALALVRSILFFLFMLITIIPWALTVVICSVVIRGKRLWWMCAGWLRVAIWGSRWICGVVPRIQGMDNLPTGKLDAVVLLSKHQSTYETFFYPAVMPHPLVYVFKKELLYVPFFGWAMARLDFIPINRAKRAEAFAQVEREGRRLMAQGNWLIMFPEGTRIARGQKGTYKTGGTRLAIATGQPVVPIAVTSSRCWARKSFLVRPGIVDISIGKPIPSQGREPEEMMREVEAWIESEMYRLDPDAYTKPALKN